MLLHRRPSRLMQTFCYYISDLTTCITCASSLQHYCANVYSTYSCVIDHLVQDVKFHLRKWQVFTGEIFHEGKKKLGMVHHAVQRSNCRRSLVKFIHSLVHVLRRCLQVIQLHLKFLPHSIMKFQLKVKVNPNSTSFEF